MNAKRVSATLCGGYASAGFAEACEDATAVKPWSFTQTNIKNTGKSIASNITYTKSTLKLEVLGKEVIVEQAPPLGLPLNLAPGDDYFYGVNTEITFLKTEQLDRFINELKEKDGIPVFVDIVVKYFDRSSSNEYVSSASYKLTRKNSYIIRSEFR